ncbi:hypothetical protein C8R43DRAFT_1179886 [Mycena crocata]|nr:hypothetical protein C8R43DRAFT_1179886 [Mycena crocata]
MPLGAQVLRCGCFDRVHLVDGGLTWLQVSLDPRGARQLTSIRTTRDCASSPRDSTQNAHQCDLNDTGCATPLPETARDASRDQRRTEETWSRRVYGNERLAAKRSCDQDRRSVARADAAAPGDALSARLDATAAARTQTVPLDSFGRMRRASAVGCVCTRAGAVLGFGPSWGIRRAERTWQLRARRDGPAALDLQEMSSRADSG